ncbi:IucA/IucC family protein [Microbacterium sp. NPDC058342]|uniref:IucA/IucC family protein n=1 Tax=Microbacterium sp. NPDC058342 TaxID=3346454 RepID=UPI0036567D5B
MNPLADLDIDDIAAHGLVRAFLREVSVPDAQARLTGSWLVLSLPRTGLALRLQVSRASVTDNHRFTGPAQIAENGGWRIATSADVAEAIAHELRLLTGTANDEFAAQARESRLGMQRAHAAVLSRRDLTAGSAVERYLQSEQSLWAGHRWHPTPKSRDEDARTWSCYAPEAAPRIALRWLSAPAERVIGEDSRDGARTTAEALAGAPEADAGRIALPVHPWQWERLRETEEIRRLLRRGDLADLGTTAADHHPTSSVRTLLGPRHFLKLSLGVRITNCVRTHAPYELTGAIDIANTVAPALAELEQRHPHVRLMRETGWRSARFNDADLVSPLGVIVREGWQGILRPGSTPLLAAALAAEFPGAPAQLASIVDPADAMTWWDRYLRLLVPFVVDSYADHGIVCEPHLQNVVVGVDDAGMPVQLFLRDLEGVKLLPRWRDSLLDVDALSATRLSYDERTGWRRTAYCLFVNNISEFVAALADLGCREEELWERVRDVLSDLRRGANRHELDALLSGVPAPAKSNLLVRWNRRPDRDAGYVAVPLPLSDASRIALSA